MNGVVSEARQRKAGAREDSFDLVSGREAPDPVKDVGGLFFSQHSLFSRRDAACRVFRRHCLVGPAKTGQSRLYEYAEPTRIFRNRAGLAPCPVPTTCCGCPLPQFGVPHSAHSSREQIASIEFQNSVVIPEYEGFFSILTRLPCLISHAISHPN